MRPPRSFLHNHNDEEEHAELILTYDGYFDSPLTSAHFGVYNWTDELKNSYIAYGFEDAEYVLQITSVVDILADEEISRLLNHIEGEIKGLFKK